MFGTRRLAKRSIIGTRICAPWQDGRFYPGVIQAMKEMASGQNWYSVLFDDGYTKEFTETDLLGQGFQGIQGKHLKHGQRIFLTQNGREVAGIVIKHDRVNDEVLVEAAVSENDRQEFVRKLDELRLLESRKSARLQDSDTDYSKLADVQIQPESKKRTVSCVIDVPSKCSYVRRPQNDNTEDIEMMDEHMAAMVLTSLSCSPVSPKFPANFADKSDGFAVSPKSEIGSLASSGFLSGTPSPPEYLSTSAPPLSVFDRFTEDDGIDVDIDETAEISTRTVFKCSWPGCVQICSTCNDIERHVRVEHLKKADNCDSSMSDHEEEFYYSEVVIAMDSMMDQFADMACTSPTALFPVKTEPVGIPVPDHDYQRKESKYHIPTHHGMSSSVPINIPQGHEPLSWQLPQRSSVSPPSRVIRPHDRLHQHQAHSPKSHLFGSPKSPNHKKARSEVKKCRKVYGMENRDMWCTQCKWKKACSRFME